MRGECPEIEWNQILDWDDYKLPLELRWLGFSEGHELSSWVVKRVVEACMKREGGVYSLTWKKLTLRLSKGSDVVEEKPGLSIQSRSEKDGGSWEILPSR